jgi:DNA-binding beta-propeller fold protein YncE
MAFQRHLAISVGTTPFIVQTVAAGQEAVLIGINLSNTTASQINVTVKLAGVSLITDGAIPAGSALSPLDGKVILKAGDTVVVTSSAAASCDVIVSALEQAVS